MNILHSSDHLSRVFQFVWNDDKLHVLSDLQNLKQLSNFYIATVLGKHNFVILIFY